MRLRKIYAWLVGVVPLGIVLGLAPLSPTPALAAPFLDVPPEYVYNPDLGARNDYCTSSPDEFRVPGAENADFRGPCARHDLCYGSGTSHFTCDNQLRADMRTNCAFQYGALNPLRHTCYRTADVYWAAVVAT
jgi:hypothetical protein